MSEYVYDEVLNDWRFDETGVIIVDEDMPWELLPEGEEDQT